MSGFAIAVRAEGPMIHPHPQALRPRSRVGMVSETSATANWDRARRARLQKWTIVFARTKPILRTRFARTNPIRANHADRQLGDEGVIWVSRDSPSPVILRNEPDSRVCQFARTKPIRSGRMDRPDSHGRACIVRCPKKGRESANEANFGALRLRERTQFTPAAVVKGLTL